jgi:hypothetical protein
MLSAASVTGAKVTVVAIKVASRSVFFMVCLFLLLILKNIGLMRGFISDCYNCNCGIYLE